MKKVDLTLVSTVIVLKFSNFPDELSENEELRGSDYVEGMRHLFFFTIVPILKE